ncbi:nime/cyclinb [Pholiota molesta]|nr:nime/cyclinb [Pholiota molesta]
MSSIPVRRTTRVVRSTKDNENANARPSRIAKAVVADAAKDEKETGIKRKREVLVEVTGLVTNNKAKASGTVAKGKEGASSSTDKLKNATPLLLLPRVAGTAVTRRLPTRATSESTTVSKTETEAPVESKPTVELIHEKMEIDEPAEDEEAHRVFKRRHTDEKVIVHAKFLDDSQAEADGVAKELEAVEPSASNVQLWDDLDAEDFDDPIMVSEYVVDVCVYLKEIELATLPNPDYMKDQAEITWEHRGVLIDWLLQVHARFGLLAESLFLTVNILDRFLGSRPISISKLQLVGLTSFFIATKFEEPMRLPYILRTLEWDLRAPGPMGWLRRASKADDCEVHARTIAKYLLEIGCVDRRFIGIVPSLLSAAAIWLARLSLGREEWVGGLRTIKGAYPNRHEHAEYITTVPVQHESLYKKYAHKRYFRCSTYMQSWSLERWPENGDVNLKKDLADIKDEIRRHREVSAAAHARVNRKQEGTDREAES